MDTPQNLNDSSDVAQNGTFVNAVSNYTLNHDSPVIGDTTFHNLNGATAPGYGNITFQRDNTANPSPFNTTDATYQDAIGYGGYTNHGETGIITFSGLTPGSNYQAQVFAFYPDNGFDPTLNSISGGTPVTLEINPGQFTIGTFTASASTFSFKYDVGTAGGAVINAIALRDLSDAPEPSTWLMMGTGAMLVLWQMRRSARA